MVPGGFPYFPMGARHPAVIVDHPPMQENFHQSPNSTWMYRKQLGRRNLTNEQRQRLIGQMYETRKKLVGAQVENSNARKRCLHFGDIVSKPIRTAKVIAHEVGVSKATVKRAEAVKMAVGGPYSVFAD